MDGWRCYFSRGGESSRFSSLYFTTLLLSIYFLLTSLYRWTLNTLQVCENSTFLVPLHFMLSATQDNKQLIYLVRVFCFVLFYFFDRLCVFFFFFLNKRQIFVQLFLSDNLWLEHHFYTLLYANHNRYPTNISFYTDIQSKRDHKNLI